MSVDDGWRGNLLEDDEAIAALLARSRTIAVVGIKSDPDADAYRIPAYMQAQGYRIRPVSPRLGAVLGESARATLLDLEPEPAIDIVNLFRAVANIPAHAAEALAMRPRPAAFWMQLGIRHARAAEELARAGILVVQDRCLLIEHRRLAIRLRV